MPGNKNWASEELEILKNDYQYSTIEEMLVLLPGRSKYSIHRKASQLGLLIRNGKQIKANKKIVANITKEQFKFLMQRRSQSRVIREALDFYMVKNRENK